MNRLHLALALTLAVLPLSAEEKPATALSTSRSSSSSTSFMDGNGNTVTNTVTERNGKRETRRTVTGPGGKVISDTNGEDDEVKPVAKPAAEKAKPGGPWLGVHTTELPAAMREQLDIPDGAGLLVDQLPPDSPAGGAGIAQHDILLTINLTPVSTPEQLRDELAKCSPGEKVLVEYLHKARREKAAVTLGKRGDHEAPHTEPIAAPTSAPQTGLPKPNAVSGIPKTTANTFAKSSTRTVIVGADGKTKVIETDGDGDPIANMLSDPNMPATMKESLRKIQEQMRDFHKRNGDAAPGAAEPARKETQ
jgi:membrane-associated protease RseP (regulator of RpoE activity)